MIVLFIFKILDSSDMKNKNNQPNNMLAMFV